MKRTPVISPRKAPKQQRSSQLVADILEAAIRVLEREGAARFTMARVAEKAGVSVGSLYQYFPNKESILFQLQSGEWDQTRAVLENILREQDASPAARVHKAIGFFFRSEHAEARLRVALEDAAPLYRDAPQTLAHRRKGNRMMTDFLAQALPKASSKASPKELAFAADFVGTTMSAIGKRVSEQNRSRAEIDAFADATARMLCLYLGFDESPRRA